MTAWIPLTFACVVGLLIIWAPGLVVVRALDVRGLIAFGIAPAVSGAVISLSAVLAPMLGLSWSVAVVAGGTGVLVVLAVLLRLVLKLRPMPARPPRALARAIGFSTGVALLMTLVVGAARFVSAVPDPARIAQTYDTSFHLNTVQMILETGDASSLHMTLTNPAVTTSFYPALWHGMVALLVQLTGVGVAQASNVLAALLAFGLWPVGVAALTRALVGPSPLPVALAALFAISLPQFPVRLLSFGILYPTLLSHALLPGVLAMFVLAADARGWRPRTIALLLGLVGWGTLALAQTSTVFALMFVLVPLMFHALVGYSRRARLRGVGAGRRVAVWLLAMAAAAVGYVVLGWSPVIAGMRSKVDWPVTMDLLPAMKSALSFSSIDPVLAPSWVFAALVAVGAVAMLRHRSLRWVPFGYLVLLALYVVARAGSSASRAELTGYWYGDAPRLAALLPLLAVPLAAYGAFSLVLLVRRLLRRLKPAWRPSGILVLIVSLLVASAGVLVVGRMAPTRDVDYWLAATYRLDPDAETSSGLLSADEERLLARIGDVVPEGVAIAGNPWDGSALTWALADREAVFPHLNVVFDVPRLVVAERLDEAEEDPEVCDAVRALDLGYVLEMGPSLWGGDPAGRDARYPGLEGLVESGVAEVVDSEGDAELLRITACS